METYKCKFCGKEFNSKAGTTRHEKYCKQNPAAVPCKTGHVSWNKGKTAKDDIRIALGAKTRADNIASGKTIIVGHKHSEESKRLISKKRIEYLVNNPEKHV